MNEIVNISICSTSNCSLRETCTINSNCSLVSGLKPMFTIFREVIDKFFCLYNELIHDSKINSQDILSNWWLFRLIWNWWYLSELFWIYFQNQHKLFTKNINYGALISRSIKWYTKCSTIEITDDGIFK